MIAAKLAGNAKPKEAAPAPPKEALPAELSQIADPEMQEKINKGLKKEAAQKIEDQKIKIQQAEYNHRVGVHTTST